MMRFPIAVLAVGLLAVSCTPKTPAPTVLSPVPVECDLGIVRERPIPPEDLPERIGWHLPRWLPESFGLGRAFQPLGGNDTGGGLWIDDQCREIEIRITSFSSGTPEGERIGEWWIEYDAPGECGNVALGRTRCLGYAARVDQGWLRVRMLGIDRPEGDRIVLSIPL